MLIVGTILCTILAYAVGRIDGIQHAHRQAQRRRPLSPKASELVQIQKDADKFARLRIVGGRDCPWLDPIE